MFFKGRHEEAALSACVAQLIGDATHRCSKGSAEPSMDAEMRPEMAAVMRVWETYALALADDTFQRHPYVRQLNNPKEVLAALAPSKEHHHFKMLIGDIILFHEQFERRMKAEILSSGFTFHSYWQARLSMLSRAFSLNDTDMKDCLVPVIDFFNHSAKPGADWTWDEEALVMKLTALRSYKKGEEIFISYGTKSNTSMFRCYGFVMHPAVEPSWGYVCTPQKMPPDLYAQYLPPRMSNIVFQLETYHLDDSLVAALNACCEHGADAQAFLHAVCKHAIACYEEDDSMKRAIEALQAARATDPTGANWWSHLPDDLASCFPCEQYPDWSEAALCLKMSEYLCLTAHLEVFSVLAGQKTEDQCLAGAKFARETLLKALPMLREGSKINVIDKTKR